MKLFSALLGGILGAGILLLGGAATAQASSRESPAPRSAPSEVRAPVAIQAGTPAEAQAYERREQESTDVQDFEGGDVIIGVGFVALVLIVVLIVLLLRD